jgi:hypothetical protein
MAAFCRQILLVDVSSFMIRSINPGDRQPPQKSFGLDHGIGGVSRRPSLLMPSSESPSPHPQRTYFYYYFKLRLLMKSRSRSTSTNGVGPRRSSGYGLAVASSMEAKPPPATHRCFAGAGNRSQSDLNGLIRYSPTHAAVGSPQYFVDD